MFEIVDIVMFGILGIIVAIKGIEITKVLNDKGGIKRAFSLTPSERKMMFSILTLTFLSNLFFCLGAFGLDFKTWKAQYYAILFGVPLVVSWGVAILSHKDAG